jgi:hypothetical protein
LSARLLREEFEDLLDRYTREPGAALVIPQVPGQPRAFWYRAEVPSAVNGDQTI